MNVVGLNIVVFWKKAKNNQYDCITELNKVLNNIFDIQPIINSVPALEQLPPDFPVVVMNSSSGRCSITIGVRQASIQFPIKINEFENIDNFISYRKQEIKKFVRYFAKNEGIIRVGVIFNCFKLKKNSVSDIINKYCKETLNECAELSLRFNKVSNIDNMYINNIVNISNTEIKANGNIEGEGILITLDINNRPLDKDMNEGEIEKLLKHIFSIITEKKIKELL